MENIKKRKKHILKTHSETINFKTIMKKTTKLSFYFFAFSLLLFNTGCDKTDKLPDGGNVNTVSDIDGNVYNTVKVGTQTWMKENLRVTKYRNGEAIPNVTNNSSWTLLTTGAQCTYNNTVKVDSIVKFGRLYNWFAISDTRNIAPVGWHVATDADWTTLTSYLGGETIAGGKLKEVGTSNWTTPNTGASNETGFNALPGGQRIDDGSFYDIGLNGGWWSSTQFDNSNAWLRYMGFYGADVLRDNFIKSNGLSVRCVKDN